MKPITQSINFRSKNFDWGPQNEFTARMILNEVFINHVYERFRQVKKGDIVLDVGANTGAFSYSILHTATEKIPDRIICLEPSNRLITHLMGNLQDSRVEILNYAIASTTGSVKYEGNSAIFCHDNSGYDIICLEDLVHFYNLKKINFIKSDCEGGEYDLFSNQNYNLLKDICEYAAVEFHLGIVNDGMNKFIEFRNKYLRNSFKVFTNYDSNTDVDITEHIIDDDYLKDYINVHKTNSQLMVYFYL